MRRHGWELPYHPLQVVAMAVFLALAFAYYVFFEPFVGNRILELYALAVYTPMVICVLILYIRCAAINPADPGVLTKRRHVGLFSSKDTEAQLHQGELANASQKGGLFSCPPSTTWISGPLCFCKSHDEAAALDSASPEKSDLLYCSLCQAEIFKRSKHCRVCDKCVDCFDHHCRWLNNCIGKKNYKCFVSLMISGLFMLLTQSSVGIWVIIHCFTDRKTSEDAVVSRLGNSFTLIPYLLVVGTCTLLSLIAIVPLGQLLCFHLVLIRKGISTYDYIIATREKEQEEAAMSGEVIQSQSTSPSKFVNYENPTLEPYSLNVSLGDNPNPNPDLYPNPNPNSNLSLNPNPNPNLNPNPNPNLNPNPKPSLNLNPDPNPKRKPSAAINPWALAHLKTDDILRAAAQARKNSSIHRPIYPKEASSLVLAESKGCERASPSVDSRIHQGSYPERNRNENISDSGGGVGVGNLVKLPDIGNEAMISPLQREARIAFCTEPDFSSGELLNDAFP